MLNALKGLLWVRDVVQILVLDRFDVEKKNISQQASTACRSLRFHSRAKIAEIPLDQVIARLGAAPVDSVILPGPSTKLGEVGSQTGYHVLASLVRALQPGSILEFGTYLGVSAHTMALNVAKSCRIYTVDLPDQPAQQTLSGLNPLDQQHVQQSRLRVGEAFLGRPTEDQIVQIRADSLTFRAAAHVGTVDFVFVDGGHSLALISKDTENAFRVLSQQGTIVWDDYFHLYPEVVSFLDDLAEQHPLCGIAGTNYVIYSRRFAPSHDPPLLAR